MRFQTLDSWLEWQQSLNPKTIELGLDRVNRVYQRLKLDKIGQKVITVAGTNGKGSTVAYYETWLKNSGYKVASFTSPHILKYNERIKLNLKAVSDESLCEAFSVIDDVREDIALTYFEFGTLAALYLISQFEPDVAILEVGLGGRLDAVNIIDADLAHITPIGLDHQDWLGDTVELIAIEKAGILRKNGLAVCNMVDLPHSLDEKLEQLNCKAAILNRDYDFVFLDEGLIEWSSENKVFSVEPPLLGAHQALNISGVLAGLNMLGFLDHLAGSEIATRFQNSKCPGRMQKIDSPLACQLWVDVGHNEQAAMALAETIRSLNVAGKVTVLLGMLSDKNPQGFVAQMSTVVDEWWLLGLDGDRGISAKQLSTKVIDVVEVSAMFDSAEQSLAHAVSSLDNQDIMLVCGSFITVESVLSAL